MIEVHNESHWIGADNTTAFKICDAGVTFPNDLCVMTLVASAPKYFIDVILLQIHCSHGLNLGGKKTISSCKFRAPLVSALISINCILFDKVSQTFLPTMVAILDTGEFCSPAFYFSLTLLSLLAFKNISRGKYLTSMVIRIWAIEIPSFDSPYSWLILWK